METRISQPEFLRISNRAMWLPLLIGIICALALVIQITRLMSTSAWVDQTDQVIAHVNYVQKLTLDIETGMRGYLLTDDPAFLDPYNQSIPLVGPSIFQLRMLVKDNPQHVARLNTIVSLFEDWLKKAEMIISLKRSNSNYLEPIRRGITKRAMDKLRLELDTFRNQEERLRDQRAAATQTEVKFSVGLILFFALFLGGVSAWILKRQLSVLSQNYEASLAGEQEKLSSLEVKTKELTNAKMELQKAHDELERRVKERTQELEAFSYSVSHDLRAPLRSIDGFSLALIEDYSGKLDSTAENYLNRIRASTQKMGQLIDDLLNLSRLTRTEIKLQKVNLSAMANEILEELHRTDPQRVFISKIQDGIIIDGDAGLLRATLFNLLSNAWKFTSRVLSPEIEFGAKWINKKYTFFVRDNGAGFDMAYADKLFGAFQRLHRANEFPGTGIGLATVRRIVHRHNGHIWAESSVGQGTTFYFTLGENQNLDSLKSA